MVRKTRCPYCGTRVRDSNAMRTHLSLFHLVPPPRSRQQRKRQEDAPGKQTTLF